MKTNPQSDPLVQKSFGAPLPDDVRQAMRRQLAAARADWQAQAETQRPVFRFAPRGAWVAAAAGLLILVSGSVRWLQVRGPVAQTAPASSFICVSARCPEKSGTCTAVFYAKDDPARWTERRIAMLGSDGAISTVTVQNPERSPI